MKGMQTMKTQIILAATASLLFISANAASARAPMPGAPQAAQAGPMSGVAAVAASSAESYCRSFRNYPQHQRCLQLHGLPMT